MKKFVWVLALASAVGLSAATLIVAAPYLKSNTHHHVQGNVEKVGLRHTHRHCHITVTLGHAKKRCHTHRHNKVVHHGAVYH
ncbi:MAG: hypothetical protein ACR2O3_05860 [Rhizobiaceae bacterium]